MADVNAAAGFAPDPQQELGLDLLFAVGENGLPASFAVCVICCRQNLKTGLLKQAAIGWLYVTDEQKIVWSAHEMDTTRDAHRDLELMITETPALSKRLPKTDNQGIYGANGQERIELATGQILKFKARTLSGGRGLTGDKVILDEAFALKAAHVGALLPTMTARPAGQVVYASSAGKSDSAVLRDVRDRGRSGASPRLSYIEWLASHEECSDPGCRHPKDAAARSVDCALDREHLWRAANPTITTGRISIQTIADLRQELPPEEFARESLGWWDEEDGPGDGVFGAGRWAACAGEIENPPPAAVGVAVSVDRRWASLAAGAQVELDDPEDAEAEPVDRTYVAAADRREGVEWLIDELRRLQEKYPELTFLADKGGPTKNMRDTLEDNDIAIEWVELDEYADACSDFFDKVQQSKLLHPSSAELDEAVGGAVWRTVGDRQVWGRRKSEKDVSMLEAATLAAHGAEKYGSSFNIY